jgi:hypothetical protein
MVGVSANTRHRRGPMDEWYQNEIGGDASARRGAHAVDEW